MHRLTILDSCCPFSLTKCLISDKKSTKRCRTLPQLSYLRFAWRTRYLYAVSSSSKSDLNSQCQSAWDVSDVICEKSTALPTRAWWCLTHCRGSICGCCNQFLKRDAVFMLIFFEILIHILASSLLFKVQKCEKVPLCGRVLEGHP